MSPTEVIAAVQSHLNNELADVPVQVAGTDERPTPAIMIEGASVEEQQPHNTNRVGTTRDVSGVAQSKDYMVSYDCQLSFEIRHDDTVEASQLRDALRLELSKLHENPDPLGKHVSAVSLGGGGEINYQFIEPTETTLSQDATVSASSFYGETDDVIEEIDYDVFITNNL